MQSLKLSENGVWNILITLGGFYDCFNKNIAILFYKNLALKILLLKFLL